MQKGRPTYLVEYGEISFKNRKLGMEHWVTEVVPEAIKAVSEWIQDNLDEKALEALGVDQERVTQFLRELEKAMQGQ